MVDWTLCRCPECAKRNPYPNLSTGESFVRTASEIDVTDDEAFARHIRIGMFLFQIDVEHFTARFSVSWTTVLNWINGRNAPHPEMRKAVLDWIVSKAGPPTLAVKDSHLSGGSNDERK